MESFGEEKEEPIRWVVSGVVEAIRLVDFALAR
jgi:hypothetical protein